jgi:hypothetical protein
MVFSGNDGCDAEQGNNTPDAATEDTEEELDQKLHRKGREGRKGYSIYF